MSYYFSFRYKDKLLLWSDAQARSVMSKALASGGLLVGSSDTVPGLLAAVTQEGFNALNAVKRRDDKPYLILIGSYERVGDFAQMPVSGATQKLMHACWPGPLTLIVKARPDLPSYMVSSVGTVALRVPQHEGLRAVLEHVSGLFSTSANLSGQPTPSTVNDIDEALLAVACSIVDDGDAEVVQKVPSTIVDCTGSEIKIVREGAYSRALLEDVIKAA